MSQEINLYQPIFRREKTVFSASTMLILSLVFLVVFLAWGWAMERRVDQLERELSNREATEDRLTERIETLQRRIEAREPDPELLERADAAERKLRGLRASRAAVRQRIPDQPLELSEPMRALGELHPDGLWLTAIELGDSGRRLALEGRALEASLFPEYLERLQQSERLDDVSLTDIVIRTEPGDEWPGVAFRVSSGQGEAP